MRNITRTKDLLVQALRETPDDFALAEVKGAIRLALSRLEHVEQKRERRERNALPHAGQWPVVGGQVVNPFAAREAIKMIDEMIGQEKQKISAINRKTKHEGEDGEETALLG